MRTCRTGSTASTENTPIVDAQDLQLIDSDYRRDYSDLYWEGTYTYEWTERE